MFCTSKNNTLWTVFNRLRNYQNSYGHISQMKLSTSQILSAYKKRFDTSMTATNPLIDGPDYSFLDGKPTPLRGRQMERALLQKEAVEKAFKIMGEVDFAIKRYDNMTQQEKEERRNIIESKLKEKNCTMHEEYVSHKKKNKKN